MIQVIRQPLFSQHQCFLQWFADACEGCGLVSRPALSISRDLRVAIGKMRLSFKFPQILSSNVKLIVPCGGYPDPFAWPFAYTHEIIPVLWDTWPRYHDRIIKSFVRHKVKLAFFTQRAVATRIAARLHNVRCVWLPEGIDISYYKKGLPLVSRRIDLLSIGRLMSKFHSVIVQRERNFNYLYRDPSQGLLFKDFDSLSDGLASAKVTVCFPRCDTHPEMAGEIETLTQRYWECMLSRTVILGRCPRELLDLIGYDPVIAVDWRDPCRQIDEIVANIGDYQELVDKNHETALGMASWQSRMPAFMSEIKSIYKEEDITK